jgi:hypothetical protein
MYSLFLGASSKYLPILHVCLPLSSPMARADKPFLSLVRMIFFNRVEDIGINSGNFSATMAFFSSPMDFSELISTGKARGSPKTQQNKVIVSNLN